MPSGCNFPFWLVTWFNFFIYIFPHFLKKSFWLTCLVTLFLTDRIGFVLRNWRLYWLFVDLESSGLCHYVTIHSILKSRSSKKFQFFVYSLSLQQNLSFGKLYVPKNNSRVFHLVTSQKLIKILSKYRCRWRKVCH